MPENLNTSYLGNILDTDDQDDRPVMVQVSNVSMVFNIANQKLNSLKEYFIALARHQLRFKEFYALDDVSFEVKKGDVFGILGTNGSGKSTMLKIVAGVLDPTKGTVKINGGVAPLIELGAGFDMELTARENVFLNGALLGYSKKYISEHFDEIVDFAEVRDFLDMPLKNYSSGMVARIAFSIATIIVPEILIVDEVLSVGDFMFQQKCEQRISDLIKNNGVTVLIVSHSNDQIERLCNKAIWIEKGHTRLIGSASDVCRAYRVVGGRVGSGDSEKKVIDMMTRRYKGVHHVIERISGDTRYSTVVLAAEEYIDDQKSVIMVGSDAFSDCMLATSLAGAIDAVVFNTLPDMIPTATEQAIKGIDPDEMILMADDGQIQDLVKNKFEAQGIEKVERFGNEDFSAKSLDVYESGKQREGWGDTAVVAFNDTYTGLISISPLLYEAKAPVFYASPDNESDNARIAEALADGFKRVIVIEEGRPIPESLDEAIAGLVADGKTELVRFTEPDPRKMNFLINDWVDATREAMKLPPLENLVVSNTDSPIDAFLIGPYASKTDSQILMYNPIVLDDAAAAFDFVDSKGGIFKKVTFLGGAAFNSDDQEVLAKSLLSAQGIKALPREKSLIPAYWRDKADNA